MCPENPAYLANGDIVFNGGPYLDSHGLGTFIAHPDGSNLHRLFRRYYSSVSGNGRWFALKASKRVVVRGPKGGLVPITPPDDEEYVYNSPSISADGEWVAYVRVHIRPKDPKGTAWQRCLPGSPKWDGSTKADLWRYF
jgi:hypothetical protein